MTKDKIYEYFINKDFNCAEAMLHAINDEYNLEIPEDSFRLIGGFGGGMACGKNCGALCGCCAAISWVLIKERAHVTPDLKETVAEFATEFTEHFGSDSCDELSPIYKREDVRCLQLLEETAQLADERLSKIKSNI